ncbi:hypothetical protein KCU66_g6807, partial [Aureobasidium melanogenum]
MDTLMSAIYTAAIIALSLIAVVALVAVTWIIGVKLAEPFGAILFNMFASFGSEFVDTEASNVEGKSSKQSQQEARKKSEKLLSGVVAMLLCFFCVTLEQTLAKSEFHPGGLWWGLCAPVLKGIFEAFVALGMLRLALTAVCKLVAN